MLNTEAKPTADAVEIARVALRNLTERGLAPTPENYAREYASVGGLPVAASKTAENDGPRLETMRQIERLIAHVSATSEGLATGMDRFNVDAGPLLADIGVSPSQEEFARILQVFTQATSSLQQRVDTSRQEISEIRGQLSRTNEELKRANELAQTDPLTGLANRRALSEMMLRDLARAGRTREAYSVAILDIDHFKKINDRYGHAAGDQGLRHLAFVSKTSVRETDAVCRYGGEEFVVLLPGASAKGAFFVVDRLRMMIEKSPFIFGGEKIFIRFSAGVAELQPGENAEQLLGRADHALYEAKRTGRNRVNLALVPRTAA